MTDYKGKILKYIDSRKRVHLIFNHYDETKTQKEIHDDIESSFGLKYKLDKTNTLKTYFSTQETGDLTGDNRYNADGDELYRFTKVGGLDAEKKNNSTAITPQGLLDVFGETTHVNLEPENDLKLPAQLGMEYEKNNTLTADKVHLVLFSNIEPPIADGVVATPPPGGHAGGRYYITNWSYDDQLGQFLHGKNVWGKHGYVITNGPAPNLSTLPEGSGGAVPDVEKTSDVLMTRMTGDAVYSTELSTATPGINNGVDLVDPTETQGLIGKKPKCYFYMYTREGDDMLEENFNKEQNRLHLLVKPYLINPVSNVATTTEGLEAKVNNNNIANNAARKIISENLDTLKTRFDALVANMPDGTTIKSLQDTDTTLQNNINTKADNTTAIAARDNIDQNTKSNLAKLQKHAEVIEEMNKTQNNYYNFEWTAWKKPIKISVERDDNKVITKLEKNEPQLRLDVATNRTRQLKSESEISKLKDDINKLTLINKSLIEIISEKI